MALTQNLSDSVGSESARRRCTAIRDSLTRAGLFTPPLNEAAAEHSSTGRAARWRISPVPFRLSAEQVRFFQELGPDLLAFYRALNRLYIESARGIRPSWAAGYLDQGKPDALIAFGRMNRFRHALPAVIRPDVLPTSTGMVITELDSVPGGIGLTACLAQAYADLNEEAGRLIGGQDGMIHGFAAMLRSARGKHTGCAAIIVSEEASDYRPEMRWLAGRLTDIGLETYCVEPREIRFTEEGLFLFVEGRNRPVGLVYRFFELFDLKNVPKAELVMYAAKKARVAVTPPYKPALEEKLAFGLFHHPALQDFWLRELGEPVQSRLSNVMPRTWILDPQPVPPTAVIPDLVMNGHPISDYRELGTASQKERRWVVKPSGFSELAWGSRGVVIGHDVAQTEWSAALTQALAAFPATPHVLQEFHKGRLFDCTYADESDRVVPMSGRARLSPYYFVAEDKIQLGGILATVCSADKKIIHGMEDAIMAPCAEASDTNSA
ncbi:hypothetical protein [Nitrospira sp. Nam80]